MRQRFKDSNGYPISERRKRRRQTDWSVGGKAIARRQTADQFRCQIGREQQPDANNSGSKTNANNNRPDAAVVSQGQTAFNSDCTQCHDAERSTSKSKSLAEWKATVARMANKDGANVPSGDRDAIATYLASLSSSASGGGGGPGGDSARQRRPRHRLPPRSSLVARRRQQQSSATRFFSRRVGWRAPGKEAGRSAAA